MHPEPIALENAGYEEDFYEWTVAQAAAIRDGRWTDLDVENVAEEIESLGRSDKRQLRSRLTVIITHLLKLHLQPDRASRSWTNTIREQARALEDLVEESPSLRRRMPEFALEVYTRARARAADEMGTTLDAVPERLPSDLERELADVLPSTKPA